MNIDEKLQIIDTLKAEIDAHGKLSPEILRKINYKFRLDWNYYSNKMEGNTLTKDETRSIMIGNVTIHGKPIRDVLEMRGHDDAIDAILKIGKGELNISERRIKDLHSAIMHEETEENKAKIGSWKAVDNYVLNYKGERFDFTRSEDVAEEMHTLINWLSAENEKQGKKGALHPALLAIEFHLRYVTIHPFYDGNGRTARILMNLILISKGFPPLIIKTEEKERYHQYIADIQGYGGNKDFYYGLMLDLLIRSLELVNTAINGGDIEEPDDIDKRIELIKNKLSGIDSVTEKKTFESVNNTLNDCIFPILQQVEEKIDRLKELFLNIHRIIQYRENGQILNIPIENGLLYQSLNTWLAERFQRTKDEQHIIQDGITELTYLYQLKGFKKSLATQYIHIDIGIRFFDFEYVIKIDGDRVRERKFGYGRPMNKQLIHDIVRNIIDRVLNEISEATGIQE
jgi:Fic family protein